MADSSDWEEERAWPQLLFTRSQGWERLRKSLTYKVREVVTVVEGFLLPDSTHKETVIMGKKVGY